MRKIPNETATPTRPTRLKAGMVLNINKATGEITFSRGEERIQISGAEENDSRLLVCTGGLPDSAGIVMALAFASGLEWRFRGAFGKTEAYEFCNPESEQATEDGRDVGASSGELSVGEHMLPC